MMYRDVKEAQIAARLAGGKVTHAPRGSSARQAKAGGVDTSEIREAAGWDRSHSVLSYLTGPVLSAISVLAGHLKNTFVMRRGRVPDEPELLAMVFPDVPEMLLEMTERNLDAEQQQDLSAQGFLQLLMWLRSVFLQDLAMLTLLQPDVALWQHPAITLQGMFRLWDEEIAPRDAKFGPVWRSGGTDPDPDARAYAWTAQKLCSKWRTGVLAREWLMRKQSVTAQRAVELLVDQLEAYKSKKRAAATGKAAKKASQHGSAYTQWLEKVVAEQIREQDEESPNKSRPGSYKHRRTMEANEEAGAAAAVANGAGFDDYIGT